MTTNPAGAARKYLWIASAVQLVGALWVTTFIFSVGVWNAYIELTRYGRLWTNDTVRTVPYVVAPLSLIAALALSSRSARAWKACRALAVTWPLAPIVDLMLLKGSLHGGELLIMMFVPTGLVFSIAVWWLTGKGRPALRNALPGAPATADQQPR